jgi:hypothetical protein
MYWPQFIHFSRSALVQRRCTQIKIKPFEVVALDSIFTPDQDEFLKNEVSGLGNPG